MRNKLKPETTIFAVISVLYLFAIPLNDLTGGLVNYYLPTSLLSIGYVFFLLYYYHRYSARLKSSVASAQLEFINRGLKSTFVFTLILSVLIEILIRSTLLTQIGISQQGLEFIGQMSFFFFIVALVGMIWFGESVDNETVEEVSKIQNVDTKPKAKLTLKRIIINIVISPYLVYKKLLYSFIEWLKREGFSFSLILLAIIILGFVLRIWNLDYLQGSDTFNVISAKNLLENGSFTYPRNLQITYVVALLYKFAGVSWSVARVPEVFWGISAIPVMYYLGKLINKKVGLLAALLTAISPVVIEKSTQVREYAENFFVSAVVIYVLMTIYMRFHDKPRKFVAWYTTTAIFMAGIIYAYSNISDNVTIKVILVEIFVLTLPILYFFIRENYRRLTALYLLSAIAAVTVFVLVAGKLSGEIFSSGLSFTYEFYWFRVFFDPSISYPMQWYSYTYINVALIFLLYVISMLKRNKFIIISMFSLMAFIMLYIYKFNNHLNYYPTRYIYHVYPFFIVIFASSIYYLLEVALQFKYRYAVISLISLFLVLTVVQPENTMHGASHDLSIYGPYRDSRQPSSLGNRTYYVQLLDDLRRLGVDNKTPLVVGETDISYFVMYFNYTMSPAYYKTFEGKYDTATNVYLENHYLETFQLDKALVENSTGYFVTNWRTYPRADFNYKDKIFRYVSDSTGYKIYKWESRV